MNMLTDAIISKHPTSSSAAERFAFPRDGAFLLSII